MQKQKNMFLMPVNQFVLINGNENKDEKKKEK